MERIIVNNISKKFDMCFRKKKGFLERILSKINRKESRKILNVLKDISFNVKGGEIVGIIGLNGSGKSTLLRIIAGIYMPDKGKIRVSGKIISLINLSAGLRERLSMKENIYLIGAYLGLTKKEINLRFSSIVEFCELQNFVYTKIFQFSDGMKQRLIFSVAINCSPEILLLDEIFSVGDERFKEKSSKKILELVNQGISVLIVSHDLENIKKYCNRVIWINKGIVEMDGKSGEVINRYKLDFYTSN